MGGAGVEFGGRLNTLTAEYFMLPQAGTASSKKKA
jgi:hypothetical protein